MTGPDLADLAQSTVFFATLLLVVGAAGVARDWRAHHGAIERRLERGIAEVAQGEALELLRRRPRRRRGGLAPLREASARLEGLIQESGAGISARRLLGLAALLASAIFVAFLAATGGGGAGGVVLGAIAAGALGLSAPLAVLYRRRALRMKRLIEQLPDALDVMTRSLHAGHPVSASLRVVAKEMPEPIGAEFATAFDEMTYGLDLGEALDNLGRRVAMVEFRYLAVSIRLHHETGGNLAEGLRGLSILIRARFHLLRKVRALSAEGRLSARVLAVLPFLFAGFVWTAQPDYYLRAVGDPLFLPVVAAALALELLGLLVMARLIAFRV